MKFSHLVISFLKRYALETSSRPYCVHKEKNQVHPESENRIFEIK